MMPAEDAHEINHRQTVFFFQVLFRIPLQWVMSSDAARQLPYLGTAFEEGKDLLPKGMEGEKMKVAIMLMFEDCKLVRYYGHPPGI
jgi:hypothetical protein